MDKAAHCIIKAAQLRARALRLEKVAELTENNRRNNAATLLNFGLGAGALGGGAYGAHRLLQKIRAKERGSALNSGQGLLGKGALSSEALGSGALGSGALGTSHLWRSPGVVPGSEILNAELLEASNGGALKTVGKGIKTVYNLATTAGETLAANRKLAKIALILGIGAGSVGAGVYGTNKLVGGFNNKLETLKNNLSIRGLLGGVLEGISNKSSPSGNIVDSAAKTSKSSTVSRGVGEVLPEVNLSQLPPQLRKQIRLEAKLRRLFGGSLFKR